MPAVECALPPLSHLLNLWAPRVGLLAPVAYSRTMVKPLRSEYSRAQAYPNRQCAGENRDGADKRTLRRP